jgi:hypothetical protein
MAPTANSSALLGSDAVGLKELSTEAFVKAYGKHVSFGGDGRARAGSGRPAGARGPPRRRVAHHNAPLSNRARRRPRPAPPQASAEVKDALQAATRAKLVAVSEGLRHQVRRGAGGVARRHAPHCAALKAEAPRRRRACGGRVSSAHAPGAAAPRHFVPAQAEEALQLVQATLAEAEAEGAEGPKIDASLVGAERGRGGGGCVCCARQRAPPRSALRVCAQGVRGRHTPAPAALPARAAVPRV